MTILQLLTMVFSKIDGPNVSALVELLLNAKAGAPDLAPQIDVWLDALMGSVSAENLNALIPALKAELSNISRGKFEGKEHPSDFA